MNLTLLIDLDDTLLPHSSERFLPAYISALSNHLSGVASPKLVEQYLLSATYKAISSSDPGTTIKQTFDENFYPLLGTTSGKLQDSILNFYNTEYLSLSPISTPDPDVISFIKNCVKKGYQLAIATNPIFPKIATYQRMRWAGLPPEDFPFSIITTYEDFHFTKPHPAYYMEILAQMGWQENQVVVIGNDLAGDILPCKDLGLATYWVTNDYTKKSCALKHGAGQLKEFHMWLDTQTEDSITPDLGGYLPSLETLHSTPAALLTFLNHTPLNQWRRKPNPDSWSITEILCHLRDVDIEVHIPRFRMLREAPSPFLTAVDADTWAEERNYQQQDGQQAIAEFIKARKILVDLITNLPENVRQKDIRHTIFGPITLDEIIRIAARHDRLHIQQIHATIN